MGIFDFLKKKKTEEPLPEVPQPKVNTTAGRSVNDLYAAKSEPGLTNKIAVDTPAPDELFDFIYKYREYVVCYINMMLNGNQSPIAAYEKANGELIGYLFVAGDMSYNISVQQVIDKMEAEFEQRITDGSIVSWTIFYHSQFNNDGNHKVAQKDSATRAISVKYSTHTTNLSLNYVGLPYTFKNDEVSWRGFSGFSNQQNQQILSATMTSDKDYFQERVEIEPPMYENAAGIKIKTVNNGSLGNMWGGIFGFEKMRRNSNIILEYMALVFTYGVKRSFTDIAVLDKKYGDVIFRGVKTASDSTRTAFPVIKSTAYIDVENKQIAEWENSENLEAVITGGGRDTFGITYFATDYAENKTLYRASKNVNIAFSAILFALTSREGQEDKLPDGTSFADGFAAYMPHRDLAEFGCYDFIGVLEDHRDLYILEDNSVGGYILQVRLINNTEIKDFFTIPMFINKDNTAVRGLKKGMKIGGMFQLQGEMVK